MIQEKLTRSIENRGVLIVLNSQIEKKVYMSMLQLLQWIIGQMKMERKYGLLSK